MTKTNKLFNTSGASSDNDDDDSLDSFPLNRFPVLDGNKQKTPQSPFNKDQQSAGSPSSSSSSILLVRKANARDALKIVESPRRHVGTKTTAILAPTRKRPRPSSLSSSSSSSWQTNVETKSGRCRRRRRRLEDIISFDLSSSSSSDSDDDEALLFQRSSILEKSPLNQPKTINNNFHRACVVTSTARKSNSNQKSQSVLDDNLSNDSDDTAELVKQLEQAKWKYQSAKSPTKPASDKLQTGDSATQKKNTTPSKSPMSSNIPLSIALQQEKMDHVRESLVDSKKDNGCDSDSDSSVDTLELSKRCPTKPGISRPHFIINVPSVVRLNTPVDKHTRDDNGESPQVSSPIRQQSPPDDPPSHQTPPSNKSRPSCSNSPVQFQLPDHFESSSSSESEAEESKQPENQYEAVERRAEIEQDTNELRPPQQVSKVANIKTTNPYRPNYITNIDLNNRQNGTSLNQPENPTVGENNCTVNATGKERDYPPAYSTIEIPTQPYQDDYELFKLAFLRDQTTTDTAVCTRNTPPNGGNDFEFANAQQPQSSNSLPFQQRRSNEDLFRFAFGSDNASEIQRSPEVAEAISRDDRTEEELFHDVFLYGERKIDTTCEVPQPHNPNANDHIKQCQVRQGFSRREPFSSPAYNIVARSFLNLDRRQEVVHNHQSSIMTDANVDSIDDYPMEESDFYRKPAPRRITADHAHHPEWTTTNSSVDGSSQFPGQIDRPWNKKWTGKSQRRIRDPIASNHSLAASVVTRRSQNRQESYQATNCQKSSTAASSRFIEEGDIRRFFRTQPLTDGKTEQHRDMIRSQRHDILGHSEVTVVNRPSPARARTRQSNRGKVGVEGDDIIEILEDEPTVKDQVAVRSKAQKSTQLRQNRGRGSLARSKGSARRKSGNGSYRGKGRGRGGKRSNSGRGKGRPCSGRNRDNGNSNGVWGNGDAGSWGTIPPIRREDPAFEGIGAEVSF
jgi:hypothetical protein